MNAPTLPEGMTVEVAAGPAAGGYRGDTRPAELVIRQRMHGHRRGRTVWNVSVGAGVFAAMLVAGVAAVVLGADPIQCACLGTIGGAPIGIPIVWMTYPELRRLFNEARVRVTNDGITVHTGPVPPRRVVELAASDVERLGVEALTESDPTIERWHVYAVLPRGLRRTLVDHLPSERHARHLEQLIERHLRIEDETE